MLWELYLHSVGPALVAFGIGVLPFELWVLIYTPLLYVVEHWAPAANRYRAITAFWTGLWELLASLGG